MACRSRWHTVYAVFPFDSIYKEHVSVTQRTNRKVQEESNRKFRAHMLLLQSEIDKKCNRSFDLTSCRLSRISMSRHTVLCLSEKTHKGFRGELKKYDPTNRSQRENNFNILTQNCASLHHDEGYFNLFSNKQKVPIHSTTQIIRYHNVDSFS